MSGANIANVALVLKKKLLMRDRLLESLEEDNTFLRMMAQWRKFENTKASRFNCRPLDLYAAVEGAPLYGKIIVSEDSASGPVGAIAQDVKKFDTYNHQRIAKPRDESDDLYLWVNKIMTKETKRITEWGGNSLCHRISGME